MIDEKNISPRSREGAKDSERIFLTSQRLSDRIENSIKFYVTILTTTFFLFSCSRGEESVPKKIISPDSMVPILVDVHLAEAAANVTSVNDVMRFSASDLYPVIYKTHHTDSVTFRKSFDYYLNHPKKFDKIYEQVINELSKKESEPALR